MRVLFVRHGLAESNVIDGTSRVGDDAALLPEGCQQIEQMAQMLGTLITTKTVVTSPVQRAVQSARILAEELDLHIELDDRLREIDKGIWQGLRVSEVIKLEAAVGDRSTFAPENGESWEMVGTRVANAVEERRRRGIPELLIVSHDHPIRMGIGKLTEKPIKTWEDMAVDNGSVTELHYLNAAWQLHPTHVNMTPDVKQQIDAN